MTAMTMTASYYGQQMLLMLMMPQDAEAQTESLPPWSPAAASRFLTTFAN